MKKLYMLRGQGSGIDTSQASEYPPTKATLAAAVDKETKVYGPNEDGSPRWVRVHEMDVVGELVVVEPVIEGGTENASTLPALSFGGVGNVTRPGE